jgi:uncharacterized LabA/DUF88 family protein
MRITAQSPALRSYRPLHVLDIDNLIGDPATTDQALITECLDAYRYATGFRDGQHAIVGTGCNAAHVLAVQSCWPSVQFVRRPGKNGADDALTEEVLHVASTGRYSHFILASGDASFTVPLNALKEAGYTVFVASSELALSRSLKERADGNLIYLPSPKDLVRMADRNAPQRELVGTSRS